MTFVPMKNHPDYEILNAESWTIRRIHKSRVVSNRGRTCGYPIVWLNGVSYKLHRLIAENFIPNEDPERLVDVKHINGIRDDNSLRNLAWVEHKLPQFVINMYS